MSFFNMNFAAGPNQMSGIPNSAAAAAAAVAAANMANLYRVAQQPQSQQVLQPQQQTATGAQSAAVGGLGTPQAAFAMPMPPAAAFGFMTASPLMPFASYPAQYAAAYTGAATNLAAAGMTQQPTVGATSSSGGSSSGYGGGGTVGYQPGDQYNSSRSGGSSSSSYKSANAIATITATGSGSSSGSGSGGNNSSSSRSFHHKSSSEHSGTASFSRGSNSGSRAGGGGGDRYNRSGSSSSASSFNKTLTPGPDAPAGSNSSGSSSGTYSAVSSSSASASNSIPVAASSRHRQDRRSGSSERSGHNNSGSGGHSHVVGFQKRSRDPGGGGGGGGDKNSSGAAYIPRGPLHYCDVCKISCAGPQTYKEHLEGQKHKKKEQQLKSGGGFAVSEGGASSAASPAVGGSAASVVAQQKPGQKTFYCELCDVTCTSVDTYNAHARGAKHLKCVKLYQKMNKAIPPAKEMIVNAVGEQPTVVTHKMSASGDRIVGPPVVISSNDRSSKAAPHTSKGNAASSAHHSQSEGVSSEAVSSTYVQDGILKDESDPEPIGAEYIEETRDRDDKLIEFNCKLCDCKFNDPYAKDMHLKGRRHRFMYKRKVNPELEVDLKPGFRNKRLMEDRARSRRQREELHRRLAEDHAARMQMRRLEEELYIKTPGGTSGGFESWDDRHVLAKHMAIYPSDEELEAVQQLVGRAEKMLKLVSDKLALEDMKNPEIRKHVTSVSAAAAANAASTKGDEKEKEKEKEEQKEQSEEEAASESVAMSTDEPKEATNGTESTPEKKEEIDSAFRQVKGVMRIGAVAKGLLLRGDKLVELAVLCQDRPTKELLARVLKALSQHMSSELTQEKYSYEVKVEDCAIIMTSQDSYKMQLKASLTSTAVDDNNPAEDPDGKNNPNLLNKKRCLALLAELRRAKWFQSRATNLPSAVIVMRILKDLMSRHSSWAALKPWPMEVLVEKALSSCPSPLSPGEALRRVLECICSGVLLKGGPLALGLGLSDPCEGGASTDACRDLREQDREDVTAAAHNALRCMAFKLIHKVLGIDVVTAPTAAMMRKRRLEQQQQQHLNNSSASDDVTAAKRERQSGDVTEDTDADAAAGNSEDSQTTNGDTTTKAAAAASEGDKAPVRFSADIEAARKQAVSEHQLSESEMQSEDMYDPGGEAAAAYEAMHLEATSATADPYASYYGPPAPPYMHTGHGGGYGPHRMMMPPAPNFRPPFGGGFRPLFRPWRGGGFRGGRGGFRPW